MKNRVYKHVIVVEKGNIRKGYSSLKRACDFNGWNWTKLVRCEMPFIHDGWKFDRINFNEIAV
jgi:hypothetical protein